MTEWSIGGISHGVIEWIEKGTNENPDETLCKNHQ